MIKPFGEVHLATNVLVGMHFWPEKEIIGVSQLQYNTPLLREFF